MALGKRVYLVNKKAVRILERYPHTTKVKFIKSGEEMVVKSSLIISFVSKNKPPKNNNNQTNLF